MLLRGPATAGAITTRGGRQRGRGGAWNPPHGLGARGWETAPGDAEGARYSGRYHDEVAPSAEEDERLHEERRDDERGQQVGDADSLDVEQPQAETQQDDAAGGRQRVDVSLGQEVAQ